MSETSFQEILDKLWQVSNIRGFPCPLYEVHKRASVFPNKDIWLYHMIEEHTTTEWNMFINIKQSFEEYKQLYELAKETEENEDQETDEELITND